MARLTGSGLAVERGGRPVLHGLSFSVAAGELLAVTGPNGSGKSTLLRVVAGFIRPAAGEIGFDGGELPRSHYLGHLDALKTGLTVRENLDFWRRMWGGGDPARGLAAVGLEGLADLPVGVLSAGQRRRVALARLLLVHRPLWLLDEPATALDAKAEARLGVLIREHLAAGGMAIAATHRDLPVTPSAVLPLGLA